MDRIKNIEDVIIGEGEVLVDLITVKRKSGIILEEKLTEKQTNQYGIVVAIGSAVKDLEVGDIVVRTRTETLTGYKYKDKDLLLVSRYNISIAVKPANFDATDELRV